MKVDSLKSKTFRWSLDLIVLHNKLVKGKEFILSSQLLRSGTATGALVREAEFAQSKADFIHKLSVALKEANETNYWLDLLWQSGYLESPEHEILTRYGREIIVLLRGSIRTAKKAREVMR